MAVVALAWGAVGIAAASGVTLGVGTSATLGKYLTGPNGHTLYTLSSEPTNGVLCVGGCLGFWPPLVVAAGGTVSAPAGVSGTLGTFVRSDTKTTQATLNGHALYNFANDKSAGDTNGEGIKAFGGTWHVAKVVVASLTVTQPPTDATQFDRAPARSLALPLALLLIGGALLGLASLLVRRRAS